MSDPTSDLPKPGDVIYVDSDRYLSHGCDDFQGGKATVARVWTDLPLKGVYVEIAENPGTYYAWDYLAEQQAEFAARYGDTWAHPDPDDRPEFNEPW